jgi:hypothetical protein
LFVVCATVEKSNIITFHLQLHIIEKEKIRNMPFYPFIYTFVGFIITSEEYKTLRNLFPFVPQTWFSPIHRTELFRVCTLDKFGFLEDEFSDDEFKQGFVSSEKVSRDLKPLDFFENVYQQTYVMKQLDAMAMAVGKFPQPYCGYGSTWTCGEVYTDYVGPYLEIRSANGEKLRSPAKKEEEPDELKVENQENDHECKKMVLYNKTPSYL